MDDIKIQLKPIESRADVESLEALQHERAQIVERWATLGAKFKGGSGVASADTLRKRHRAGIMCMLQQEKNLDEKFAFNKLEVMANADERHKKFCDELMGEFTEFLILDVQKAEIEERIQSREMEMRAYTAEMRLQ